MDKPIYIVVTSFFPTPESWRGAFCYDFVKAVQRTGKYDVRVFVPWAGDNHTGDYEYHGISVHRFHFYRFLCDFAPFLLWRLNRRSFLVKAKEAGIAWDKVRVYHSHGKSFTPYVETLRKQYRQIKTLLHFHSGTLQPLSAGRLGLVPIHSTLLYYYYKFLHEIVDVPVFVSKLQQKLYWKWYRDGYLRPPIDVRDDLMFGRWIPKIQMRPSVVLYNGYDTSVFNAYGRKSHSSFRIGCVGNVNEPKDQLTLLRAVNRLKGQIPDLQCICVGSGDRLDACQQYVKDNALESLVAFKTEMDHLDLPDFYRSLDLFVLPSWVEGFCCSYMEAYGCGTPFMGCREVSVEEALPQSEWDKWLFRRQNDGELAARILAFYKNRYEQKLSRDFNIDTLIGEFVANL